MSLPEADLIWHCPYIVLFYSDDRKVGESRLLRIQPDKAERGRSGRQGIHTKQVYREEDPGISRMGKMERDQHREHHYRYGRQVHSLCRTLG